MLYYARPYDCSCLYSLTYHLARLLPLVNPTSGMCVPDLCIRLFDILSSHRDSHHVYVKFLRAKTKTQLKSGYKQECEVCLNWHGDDYDKVIPSNDSRFEALLW